jgi:hypothetical protein
MSKTGTTIMMLVLISAGCSVSHSTKVRQPAIHYQNVYVDGSVSKNTQGNGPKQSPFRTLQFALKTLWPNGNGLGVEAGELVRVRILLRALDANGAPIVYKLHTEDPPIHVDQKHDFEIVGGWEGETERPVLDGGITGNGEKEMENPGIRDAFHRFRFTNCHHFAVRRVVFRNFQFAAILIMHSSYFEVAENMIGPVYNICLGSKGKKTRFAYGTQSIGLYKCNELAVGYNLKNPTDEDTLVGRIHDNIVISNPVPNAHNWGIYFTGGVSRIEVYRNIVENAGISFKSIHGKHFETAEEAGTFHHILVHHNLFSNCRTGISLYDGNKTDSFVNQDVVVTDNWFEAGNRIHMKWEFEDDCFSDCPQLSTGGEQNHCWSHGSMIKNIGVQKLVVKRNLFDFSKVNMDAHIRQENGIIEPVTELRVFQFAPHMAYSYDSKPELLSMAGNIYLFSDKNMLRKAVQALYTSEKPDNRQSFVNWHSHYDPTSTIVIGALSNGTSLPFDPEKLIQILSSGYSWIGESIE